ncbi:MAG: ABC transporter ATP-binding protein [Oscillospiraceae bacterium]|nr:ABC transporter ATP-binding protein [Oscillospiraceae bacterium]
MEPLIQLTDISKIYGSGEAQIHALDRVTLSIQRGEFAAIIGHSGSGKSTLMNLLGCLDFPTQGAYLLDGKAVSGLDDRRLSRIRNQQIGFIFQSFNLVPGLSAQENVELPLLYRGIPRAQRSALAARALERVGLSQRTSHLPGQLSGGQQQRVAIARAIAGSPPVLLADEPTGNLDSSAGQQIMELLCGLWRQGRTLILITHDPVVAQTAPRIIRIQDGKIVRDSAAI